MSIKMTGSIELRGTTYTPVGMKGNKLLLESKIQYGIYFDQVKEKSLSRVIRNGEIKLENQKINVMGINGVEFHLKDGGFI